MKVFLLLIFLTSSVNCIKMECNYVYDEELFQYTCQVTSLTFIDDSKEISELIATDLPNMTRYNVTRIDFRCTESFITEFLDFIPQGITKPDILPGVSDIRIYFCLIETLNSNDLSGYPNLRIFHLYRTEVRFVPGDFFQSNPNIERMIFLWNRIESVGTGLIDGFEHLHNFYFYEYCLEANIIAPPMSEEFQELSATLEEKCPEIIASLCF